MKKFFLFFMAAATMIGCSKEQIVEDNTTVENSAKGIVVSFTADIPDFVSPDTKATVDGTSFTWQADDKIAVPVSGGYVDFTYSGAGNTFSRVLDGSEEFVDGTAYYPASSAPGGSYSTSFATVADAQKGFKMEAEYTVGSSSLSFTHKSALIHLQFTNVPSIATKLVVNDGTEDVAVVNFTSPTSSMNFYVPITPNGSKTYTFKLQENANVLKQVAKAATLAANTYYTTPIVPVGNIILVKNETSWGGLDIYCYSATDSWNNASFDETAATVKSTTISGQAYNYVIVKDVSDSYSFVFRKPGQYYPRVEHKGVSVSGTIYLDLNTTDGVRVHGDTTPRLIVYNQDKIGPVYIHYWGKQNNTAGTTWGSNTSSDRKMITKDESGMHMQEKCSGLIYTGDDLNGGNWYFYYDLGALAADNTAFGFRLHQDENKGSEFDSVTLETNMLYGWWNNNGGGEWAAGAWKL